MAEQVDDRIECLECGRWFRSVANHVYPAHGMTSDEYRITHRLSMSDPLQGADTTARRQEAAYAWMESDPDHLKRMHERRDQAERKSRQRPEVREIMSEHRQQREAEKWSARLASQGWSSWQDAADWVIDQNVSWVEVGELWGVTVNSVWHQAQAAGVEHLDRRVTDRQRDLLRLAEERMAERRTLRNASPAALSVWLSQQRRLAGRGVRMRVHAELDRIDPDWRVPPKDRANPPCIIEGCEEPRSIEELCRIHYGRRAEKQRRDALATPEEQIECLECGERFRSVSTHVWQVHEMSAEDYRERHGLDASEVLTVEAIRARRRELSARPLARAQIEAMQLARWGGSVEERWAAAFARAGWTGWGDAVEWALAENTGYPEIAERLGFAETKVRAHAYAAGVDLLPALTPAQLECLELARAHVGSEGDLAHPRPPRLARWIEQQRTTNRVNGSRSRAHAFLDELDPDWRRPQAERPRRTCTSDGCATEAGASGLCKRHLDASYRARAKAEAARAMGLPEDTTEHLGQLKQKAQAARDWAARFAACGWSGWPDAFAWAIETNVGWVEIAERLGVSKDFAYTVAKREGFEIAPPIRAVGWRMLALAAAHVAEHGDLSGPLDPELADWLTKRRATMALPKNRRVADRLAQLDPGWSNRIPPRIPGERRLPPQNRPRPEPTTCAAEGCTKLSKAKACVPRNSGVLEHLAG